MKRSAPLSRGVGPKRTTKLKPGRGFAASKEQRAKVNGALCIICGSDDLIRPIDPAHLAARSHGGCDDPLCVVALCRFDHRRFDEGRLDLLPALVGSYVPELQHALGHYQGDLLSLLKRVCGVGFVPEEATERSDR